MNGSQRGFSLAEMLTVLVVVGLAMSVMAFSIPLFLNGPVEAQSQVDNVEAAALALYKMQHDARPSDIQGIFACTTLPVPVCSTPAPGPSPSLATAVVLITANGNGQFSMSGGSPNWQGYIVYYLTPNADGSSNELRRAFVPNIGPPLKLPILAPAAVAALVTALGLSNYTTEAQDVTSLSAAVDTPNSIVELQLVGGDTSGNKSSLHLAGNSYVRN